MDIRQVLEFAEVEGWAAALYYCNQVELRHGGTMLEDERMADWRYLLPTQPERVVLAIGAGWGTVPIALAENAAEVYVVDRSAEKVAFLNIRRRQQQLDHLHPIHVHSWSDLEFADASFDLIAVREFDWDGEVHASFYKMVQHLHRLLRPGGVIQLTVGNRLAFQHLFRLEQRQGSSRVYTERAYRHTLQAAGFNDIQFYAPLPHYDRIPMFYVSLDDNHAIQFFFSHLFPLFERVSPEAKQAYSFQYAIARAAAQISLKLRLTLLATSFVPGFCIFARRNI